MNNFEAELKKLTREQKAAVTNIEGPVMVVAGPGSGKTQVVALRIAYIISKTQLGARNILALTFTDAGATALRERLTSLIGPVAYQVTIATFHGFANEVIGTFPHIFSFRQLTQLDELERLLITEKIIKSNPSIKVLRPMRAESRHVKGIISAIKICKQEAITPEMITDHAKKEVIKGTSKAENEKNSRQQQVLLEFAEIFRKYELENSQSGRYDYEDMILMVIEALKNNLEVKAYFQERYQYIHVDEYQDTNNSQNQLVELLADFFEVPNLFVVGDDKQAIYRFQGASVANMLHFYRRYPHLKIISLTDNFRSTPEILAAADRLIDNNQHQISRQIKDVATSLVSRQDTGPKPKLVVCRTNVSEQLEVVKIVKQQLKAGVPPEQIALLLTTNAEVVSWKNTLEKSGIPVAGIHSTDLLKEPAAQLLLHILQAVTRPTNDVAATAFLRISIERQHLPKLIEAIGSARKERVSVISFASKSDIFKEQVDQLLGWHQQAAKTTLVELVEEVIFKSNLLTLLQKNPSSLSNLELFSALISQLYSFAAKNQMASLADWLSYLELHNSYGISFGVQKNQAELSGVTVSTVHQAKGLEYDTVILPNVTDKSWRVKPDRSTIRIPDELAKLKSEPDAEMEDLRRLFYVAITRAKKKLCFTYAAVDLQGKTALPSQLIVEIDSTIERSVPKQSKNELEQFIWLQISPTPLETLTSSELRYIREKVKSSPFSFTAFWDYKTCPRTYLLRHVYGFPTPFNTSLIYGSAVHRALELFNKDYRNLKHVPSEKVLLGYFTEAIEKGIPFGDRNTFLAQGIDLLSDYHANFLKDQPAPAAVEYSFTPHRVMLGDIWLTGKLDLIEPISLKSTQVKVVDYKTGAQSKSRNSIEGNTQDSDGRIKSQLVYYALLCQLDKAFPYTAKDFEIRFVDDKKSFAALSFNINNEEIDVLSKEITKVFQEILTAKSFPLIDEKSEIGQLFPSIS